MSLKRAIQTFFKDPEPTDKFADVEPGVNIVDGIVKIEEPLRSPVRGENCVGYHYRSFLVLQSPRNPQPMIQKIKEAEVYSPFDLEMEGGTVHVIPPKATKFTREIHMDLKDQYGQKFQGVEEVILPGAKVRLKGKMKLIDGKPTIKMSIISVLEKQKVQKGVVGDRKKRKKSK
ncbi:MAG: hypothetical protein JXX29_14640 [Deltaproteobacteria bacterium]|nr:hypothetical protein [Deltaproteobacteria bacterium]MBN2672918.1 hypothetical protein [Deltaproteobacteria bacterium]